MGELSFNPSGVRLGITFSVLSNKEVIKEISKERKEKKFLITEGVRILK